MFYQRHIFFCTNQKENSTGCGYFGGENAAKYTTKKLKELDLWGESKVRVSRSGCLGRCACAPVCVVYPEGIWYSYVDESDLDEIIGTHLVNGAIVDRLRLE